jgi:hypothetical protein
MDKDGDDAKKKPMSKAGSKTKKKRKLMKAFLLSPTNGKHTRGKHEFMMRPYSEVAAEIAQRNANNYVPPSIPSSETNTCGNPRCYVSSTRTISTHSLQT